VRSADNLTALKTVLYVSCSVVLNYVLMCGCVCVGFCNVWVFW
jgi:hypothetical protein